MGKGRGGMGWERGEGTAPRQGEGTEREKEGGDGDTYKGTNALSNRGEESLNVLTCLG